MSYSRGTQRSAVIHFPLEPTVKIDSLEKQWELKDGVMFRAVVTKQPRYKSWSVSGDNIGKREWRNDIDKLDPKTEAQILRHMRMIMRNRSRGMIFVDITDFPMIQCTFEEEYDPFAYTPALSQRTVPFALINQGISLRSLRHFAL